MDKIAQQELLESTLDNLLELQALSCYADDHYRAVIALLRQDLWDFEDNS